MIIRLTKVEHPGKETLNLYKLDAGVGLSEYKAVIYLGDERFFLPSGEFGKRNNFCSAKAQYERTHERFYHNLNEQFHLNSTVHSTIGKYTLGQFSLERFQQFQQLGSHSTELRTVPQENN